MIILALQFALAAFAIVVAGWFLVRFADQIAEATKFGRLFVGSIFLAAATSLPELSVDLNAVANKMPDLAVGDLIGSSLFNLFILAVADLMHRGPSKIFTKASSQHALAGAMSMNLTAITAMAIFLESRFPPFSIFDVGLGPIAIGIAYVLGLRLIYFNQKVSASAESTGDHRGRHLLLKASVGYVLSALVIFIAAPFLAEAGGKIATLSGLGTTFVGTTLIALSTSLPELVSTIAAVRRGAFDLAIGNIFGSNTFNMLLLIPLDLVFTGSILAAVSPIHIFTCLSTILVTSVAVLGQLYHVEKHKRLIEPDAFAVILLVVLTLLTLYLLPTA